MCQDYVKTLFFSEPARRRGSGQRRHKDVALLGPHDAGQIGVATGCGVLSRSSLLQGASAFLLSSCERHQLEVLSQSPQKAKPAFCCARLKLVADERAFSAFLSYMFRVGLGSRDLVVLLGWCCVQL
jgi:hypothetical protein